MRDPEVGSNDAEVTFLPKEIKTLFNKFYIYAFNEESFVNIRDLILL